MDAPLPPSRSEGIHCPFPVLLLSVFPFHSFVVRVPQDQQSIIVSEELVRFADVFAGFEIKHHGRASPKPIIPPFRRRLDINVRGQVTMETYEEVDPKDPNGPKYVDRSL